MSFKADQPNMAPESLAKLYAQEATKEIIKAKIAGKIFKMAEFSKIRANPKQYEPEIARWKGAINKALVDTKKATSIAKKHMYLWGPEDEKPDDKYAELPINGVPKDKTEIVALMKCGRLGPKYKRTPLDVQQDADEKFNTVVQQISGGLYTTLDDYIKPDTNKEIAEAVELAKLTLASALNAEMEGPFIKGQWRTFKSVMAWVDNQTEIVEKTEYMHELFDKITEAFDGDSQVDAKCMEYRMALESLYIEKGMKFPDWEFGDEFAETFEADGYTPTLSFMFLWVIHKQIGKTTWLDIEEEFKREIGAENYNKEGWMSNKAKLFKLINKKAKLTGKAKIASLADSGAVDEATTDDDDITVEMDDGTILKIQPKFRGTDGVWRQNFTKQFNLQQGPNNRWQRRRQQQQNRPRNDFGNQNRNQNGNNGNNSLINKNFNNSANNRNGNKGNSPSPDQTWKCRKCENEGRNRICRGDQQCPRHKWRPRYFENVPLAAIKSVEANDSGDYNDEQQKALASLASIRMTLYDEDNATDEGF